VFRFFKSIRAKLTLWYAIVLLATLLIFGLVAYKYSSDQLSENLDRSLKNEVKWVNNVIIAKASKLKPSRKFSAQKKSPSSEVLPSSTSSEAELSEADTEIWSVIYEHALMNPRKTLIEVTDNKGKIIFRTFTAAEESLMIGDIPMNSMNVTTHRTQSGEEFRVVATANEAVRIYAAYPLSELKEVLGNLFSIFLIFIPIALSISVGVGWFLAYTSLKPVDMVTSTARRITAENLNQQIPYHDIDDEIGRLISTFNDMILRLHDSFDNIKQFSIDASHELRTPLTIMRGEVELALRHPKEAEEYRRILASNLEEVLRLSAIIDNLHTLSKADQGQHVVSMESTNLKELMEELFEDCEILAAKKHIIVEFEKSDDISIHGDKIRLRQLFLNLIENAIKYTPDNGKVLLNLERQNGFAIVQVKDTGVGIPKEEQNKIFDRFYRVDKARSRELGGSGLGLSIAKWIAELHRGRIEVESEPHQGSTFSVFLPLP